MSRCIFNQLKCCRSRFTQSSSSNYNTLTITSTSRNFSNKNNENNSNSPNSINQKHGQTLGQTTILVQQGCDIQELPVIMRKIGQDELVALCSNATSVVAVAAVAAPPPNTCTTTTCIEGQQQPLSINQNAATSTSVNRHHHHHIVDPDTTIKELENCVSATGILNIIDQLAIADMTPEIAVLALDKLIRICTMIELKNLEDSSEVFMKIIACITQQSDAKTLLDTLDILRMFADMKWTIQKICDELLTRNSDECLTIVEICESVHKFVQCKQRDGAEKFWSGLSDMEKQITAENIKFIYQVIPKLKVSRRMIVGVLERNIVNVFWHMTPEAVVDVLAALVQCKSATPPRTMQSMTRWLNINIHAVSETHLEAILNAASQLDYTDGQLEKAAERYVKAKGAKIKSQVLIVELLQHCAKFRLRNVTILNGCAEYFAQNSSLLDSGYLKSVICTLGNLSWDPVGNIKFWLTLETYLDEHFSTISPCDIVHILLACIYLEKYPLNFIHRIFNPHFLDSIHSTTPIAMHPQIRSDLKLFDAALTIECANYNGPMLPRDHSAKSIWQDGRIKRIVQVLSEHWANIAGGPDKYSKSIVHQQLPLNQLYVIDILIHPPGMGQLWKFNALTDRNVYVACIVHVPEHFDSKGRYLNGAQTMRIRHLRLLGLKVVTLDYDRLARLQVHGKELHRYLVERMRQALPAINSTTISPDTSPRITTV